MVKKTQSEKNPVAEELVTSSKIEKIPLSEHQRLQLEEQIRMFVQLLSQFYLLSCRSLNDLNFINESSKQTLVDLKRLASENNIFNVYNLSKALDIVEEFEKMKEASGISKKMNSTVGKTMVNSDVFIYPELLPKGGFNVRSRCQKISFTKAEDNLIALGLEIFSDASAPLDQIHMHLLPTKKTSQIKIRIKNLKSTRAYENNPIKHYYTHKEAPPMPRNVKIFDPSNVRAPKDYPYKYLPDWMIPLISKAKERCTQKILPDSLKRGFEPFFILPQGITIQGDSFSMFQSSKEFDMIVSNSGIKIIKKDIVKPKKKKPPFILPKGILKNNKELDSDVVGTSGLKSNANNNSKNESKQNSLLKNDVCGNKIDKSNTTYNLGKSQDVHNPLVMFSNKGIECNSSECIAMKNDVQDKPMSEHLIVPDNGYQLNATVDIKNDEIQSRVMPLVINGSESNHSKDVNKPSDALCRNVANKNSENKNSKGKVIKRGVSKSLIMVDDENNEKKSNALCKNVANKNSESRNSKGKVIKRVVSKSLFMVDDENNEKESDALCKNVANKNSESRNSKGKIIKRVVSKSLFMVDDENNEKKEFNSNSINLNNIKYHNEPVIEPLSNENNAFSLKKQKISATVDYFPDPTSNECSVIIKSEVIEECDESAEEVSVKDCIAPETLGSSFYSVNEISPEQTNNRDFKRCKLNVSHTNSAVNQNVNNLENAKTLDVNEKKYLVESTPKNNISIINKKECESLNNACTNNIVSNKYSNLQIHFRKHQKMQSNRFKNLIHFTKSRENKNNLRKYECTSKQNSNFVETEIGNNQSSEELSESSKLIPSQLVNHIKQEITDDFEIAQGYEFADDVNINESVMFIKPEINNENDTKDIKSTFHNNPIIKTVDYLQCSNGEECDIIIKSEITESLDDVFKIDLNLEKALQVDSSSPTKDYKASLRKRNLRSVSQNRFTKKNKTLHDNSYALTEFSTSIKKSYDLPLMQKIENNDENAKTDFIGNINTNKINISTQSQIIQDSQTFLHGTSSKIFNKPVSKTTKNVIKSNSLEKAHFKKTSKRVKQTRKMP